MAVSKAIIKFGVQKSSLSVRYMSQQQRKGFIGGLIDNIKEEFNKNKDMKDTIKKFRDEAKKLEDSDALKEARKKYKLVEEEKAKSSQIIKEKLGKISDTVKESELTKKAFETSGKVFKRAQETAQDISKTQTMKIVSENVKAIKSELDDATRVSGAQVYRPPKELRRRTDPNAEPNKVYESNTEDQGVVLHKDSKWYQSWNNFKDNNTYVNKLFDLKTKFDESENPLVRMARSVTDRVSGIFGSVLSPSEMSNVVTEITKMDPNFEIQAFTQYVQTEIIPNILESVARQDLDVLKDWCTDTAFTILSHPIATTKQLNFRYHSQVLDVRNVEIAAAKMMEQGPVLILTFVSHQVIYVSDLKGEKIIEGKKDQVAQVHHVWALCRDQTELDPKKAWRVMECQSSATELKF